MKNSKPALLPTAASAKILDEMAAIEADYQRKRESKKNELETVRQDLIVRLRKVDAFLGTNSFVGGLGGVPGTKGRRLKRGELEQHIKDALAKGPAAIGEILRRIHACGVEGKDGSIRSKMGNSKWITANNIIKSGSIYSMKK